MTLSRAVDGGGAEEAAGETRESLPKGTRRRVTALMAVQEKHRTLEHELKKEMFALEKKYQKLYQPFFERRAKIVSGAEEPSEEEIAAGKKVEDDDRRAAEEAGEETEAKVTELKEEEDGEGDKDAKDGAGIPEFWLTAMKNHMRLADLITERDQVPLAALTDIELSYLPDETPGYSLVFKFAENDTFANRELIKTYYYRPEPEDGDLMYERADGCKIDWKPDQDLTVTVETKRQRHKVTNQVRLVKKTVPAETFFDFFNPPVVPVEGSKEDKEIRDDEREELSARLELDYELGEEFKDKLIPKAVDWFTGKALEYEEFDPAFGEGDEFGDDDDEEDDDDDDDDEEDDEDEDDGDDDEDEEDAGDEKRSDKGDKPPECKQQ